MSVKKQGGIHRVIESALERLVKGFPVVSLVGPRQSGKTTLVRSYFSDYAYVTLEDLDNRSYAENDPRGFLNDFGARVVIDEVQRCPALLSYMQTKVDESDEPGQYVLTGSANLTLLENLTQSLAGRAAILKLLPLSYLELKGSNHLAENSLAQLFRGFYPRLYKHNIDPTDWYPNYIQTYLEKDVRDILNIKDLLAFKRFLELCAGRHGQLLDVSQLANDCSISRPTVSQWLSVLEASYLIYMLPSFHKNYSKRLVKSPKLYFYDSGLVCALLKIETEEQLKTHYLRGAIFEGCIITEVMKYRYNHGLEPHVYYWKEGNGNEIDCIIEKADSTLAVEIKSGMTLHNDFFKGLRYWQRLTSSPPSDSYLVYAGSAKQKRESAHVLGWGDLDHLLQEIV